LPPVQKEMSQGAARGRIPQDLGEPEELPDGKMKRYAPPARNPFYIGPKSRRLFTAGLLLGAAVMRGWRRLLLEHPMGPGDTKKTAQSKHGGSAALRNLTKTCEDISATG